MEKDEYDKIFREMVSMNATITTNMQHVATNLKELNDQNALHHAEMNASMKLINKWLFKLILLAVGALAILAGIEKVDNILALFI